jgi:hypothetical protein
LRCIAGCTGLVAAIDTATLEALVPDRWVASHPEPWLDKRGEEPREAQAHRRRKRAGHREDYGGLFNGGSYFAPEGGLAVSRCWKRENKLNEAKQTLEEVVRRFPAYKGKVKYLLQQLSPDSKRE